MTGIGQPPVWYLTIRAARYLGVPPWDLEEMPLVWQYRALVAQSIEAEVEAELMRRSRA